MQIIKVYKNTNKYYKSDMNKNIRKIFKEN